MHSLLVALVESESRPMGVTLVNTLHTNKMSDSMDLVELAKQVQKVGPDHVINVTHPVVHLNLTLESTFCTFASIFS